MRTITFTVQIPKNVTLGNVKQKVHDIFTVPMYATGKKIKDVARNIYKRRERMFSMSTLEAYNEEYIRAQEEKEKVDEGKELFRGVEQIRDLEFA